MNLIIYTLIVALAIGFALGVLLGLFKKIFYVKVDPKIQEVRDVLSGANCGGCVAGGSETTSKVASILGVDAGESVKKVAFLACAGTKDCAKDKGIYSGVETCQAAQLAVNGTKLCAFGCIGYGDCVEACPFDAIMLGANGLPVVLEDKCVGCGKCTKACPKHLLKLIPAETKGAIAKCSCQSDNKPQIRKDCTAGCFKCGLCAKKCPEGAIDISSGFPVIDYTKCTSCGECVKACVDKVLVLR